MNFEVFVKAWQCQPGPKLTVADPEAAVRKLRLHEHRTYRAYLILAGLEATMVLLFLFFAIWFHNWADYVMAFVCFFICVFTLVDRWLQHRRRSVTTNETLASCIQSSLMQVKYEISRYRSIFWWYLLPIDIGFTACAVSWCWDLSGHQTWWVIVLGMIPVAIWLLFCGLISWFTYWLHQRGIEKKLEPRRKELEELLASLNENPPVAAPPKKNSNMKTLLLILLLSIAIPALVVIAHEVIKTNSTASSTPATGVEAICQKYKVPALAVVVTKDGKICDRAAAGVRKWGDPTPVTTNDVFHIGSCTKSMTATLAAMFIEQGKLRWDTTIAEVFPELKGKMDKRYEGVTVEQLLHHRGGVPHEPPAAAWKRAWQEIGTPTEQRREFVEAVLKEPPAAAPGEKEIYSNQGYAIVGAMLEKISGRDFESLMTEKLFKPLHMDTAGFGPPGTKDKVDQPWGHVRRLFMTVPQQTDNPPAISPAGRVHCSLDDLARYAMFHLQENATNGLLKPETMARLHKPDGRNIDSPVDNYACGWVVLQRGWAGGRTLWHNGSNTMWYVVMWLAPEKNFCVIVATNVAGDDAEKACDDAAVLMIDKWLPEK